MLLSITDALYVLAMAVLAGLRPLLRFLFEVISVSVYLAFLAVAYAVVRVSLGVQTLITRWHRPS